jgi:hemoglobin
MTMQIVKPAALRCAAFALFAVIAGCGPAAKEKSHDFFTSGSHEADQRAEQRMAKSEQLRGSGEGSGEKTTANVSAGGAKVPKSEDLKSLYDRLGGEKSIAQIMDDFVNRAMADPRVNWERKGITVGGFTTQRNKSVQWNASPLNVAQLKKHLVQFLSLSTGGPSFYDGPEMKNAHTNLHITNAEFDAAIGDLKASLDKLQVPNKEQKEVLAIFESTRPQVVEER